MSRLKKNRLEIRAPKRFGKRIRDRRIGEGWTQQGVADHLGYSFQHISGVERGYPNLDTNGISIDCAIALGKFFGIPQKDFIKKAA